jgi:hypothetical protein
MTVSVKIKPINLDYNVAFGGMLSPEARSATLAQFAREKLAEADAKNAASAGGAAPSHDTFVDGVAEAPLEQVRPDGVIIFKFHLIGEAIQWVDQALINHSPRDAADRYERSHVWYADGVEFDPMGQIPTAQEFVALNLQPYSRKIEGTSKPPESPQAPEGVYEAVATLAHGKYGRVATIGFTYRAPLEGAVIDWANSPRRISRRQQTATARSRDIRQPAIVIKVG